MHSIVTLGLPFLASFPSTFKYLQYVWCIKILYDFSHWSEQKCQTAINIFIFAMENKTNKINTNLD